MAVWNLTQLVVNFNISKQTIPKLDDFTAFSKDISEEEVTVLMNS